LLADWRYRIEFVWYCLDKGTLAFYALLPLPFAALVLLVYWVHGDYERMAAERSRRADLTCLAENIYHEARGEPVDGQYAVAAVTLNRVESPLFPDSVCAVVHEKRWDPLRGRHVGAFSWTELGALPRPRGASWRQAVAVATAVYDGERPSHLRGALYYHADHVEPYWASTERRVASIGRHVFYR
jgi:spore germination cell wall hydrolase CwlJ-like protein